MSLAPAGIPVYHTCNWVNRNKRWFVYFKKEFTTIATWLAFSWHSSDMSFCIVFNWCLWSFLFFIYMYHCIVYTMVHVYSIVLCTIKLYIFHCTCTIELQVALYNVYYITAFCYDVNKSFVFCVLWWQGLFVIIPELLKFDFCHTRLYLCREASSCSVSVLCFEDWTNHEQIERGFEGFLLLGSPGAFIYVTWHVFVYTYMLQCGYVGRLFVC